MVIVKDKYYDFGPTLAAEKLAEIDGINISKETLRKLMVEAGLWKTRTQRLKRAYQPRYRRECYGELIQIDGSEHAYNKILYLIEDTFANRKIARKRVTVYDCADGSIEVRYEGKPLPYSLLHDRLQRVESGEVVKNKRLSNVLAFIQEKQAELSCERSKSVPKRHCPRQ